MAKLDAKERRELPKGDFAMPSKRKWPINDKAHARVAKAYASKEDHEGKLSSSEKSKIDRMADRKLGVKSTTKNRKYT